MRFPVIQQHDSMQCGIACLQMICKYHGRTVSASKLDGICHATTEGVSLLGMNDAANELGLHTVCGRVTMEQLCDAPMPCILHWNQNHFVVLYKVRKGNFFYIADPGKGLVKYDKDEFVAHWVSTRSDGDDKGVAMFLNPTPLFYDNSNDGVKRQRSFRFLFGYIKQYRRYFAQIILGLLLGSVLQPVYHFHAGDKATGLRATQTLGMGRRTGRPVQGADEKPEVDADAGGRQHIHKRTEECHHNRVVCHSSDTRRPDTRYDARRYVISRIRYPH